MFEGTGAPRARCGSSMVQHIWGNRNSLAWLITVGSVSKCHTVPFSSLVVPELVFVFVCLVSWLFFKTLQPSPPLSQEAEDIFFELYELEQSNIILAQSLAYCYMKNGKPKESIAIYEKLYKENPYQENIANNYFLLLLESKKVEEAKSVLETFKIDFPDSTKISVLEENLKKATEVPEKTENKDIEQTEN